MTEDRQMDPHRETSQSPETLLGKAPTCQGPHFSLIRFLDVAEVRASKGRRETRPSSVARMFCFRHWCVPQYGFWGRETRPPQGARVRSYPIAHTAIESLRQWHRRRRLHARSCRQLCALRGGKRARQQCRLLRCFAPLASSTISR